MLIKRIQQNDNYTFSIEWSDGLCQEFKLNILQKNCPCAACVDESTGQRLTTKVDDKVKAVRVKSVGRYAIKITYTSGCSTGIYHFEDLRKLGQTK